MRAAHAGTAGVRVREARFESAERVVNFAREVEAQFMLLAGDTFAHNAIERSGVVRTAEILASFERPVYLLPGNSDPLMPGSVWHEPVWNEKKNITLLLEPVPVDLGEGVLYPCPVTDMSSEEDPTAWIDANESTMISIGVAHGAVEGAGIDDATHPIPANAGPRLGLDYLALGHCHYSSFDPSSRSVRMAYSGTHEGTGFGKKSRGSILVIELPSRGEAPGITQVSTSSLNWLLMNQRLDQQGGLGHVRRVIESLGDPLNTLLRLNLEGVIQLNERAELERIREVANSRFLYAHIDDSSLFPGAGDEGLIASIPDGVLREAAVLLVEYSDPDYEGDRPVGFSSDVASRAIVELYNIMNGEPL